MSKKRNTERGGKKAKDTPSGLSPKKHGKSGTPHNHAVSIARVREENERLENERKLREKQRKNEKWVSKPSDLFK